MIFKSIKWRLQLWYGLILVLVLAGFGFSAWRLERGRQMRRTDDALQRRIQVLATALHPPPGRPGLRRSPFGSVPLEPPPGQAPPDQFPHPPLQFRLPERVAVLFSTSAPDQYYFIIQLPDGRQLARSTNAPVQSHLRMNRGSINPAGTPPQYRSDLLHRPFVRTLGNYREMVRTLPSGETIRVGTDMVPEWKALQLAAVRLAVVGAGILLLGLAGGWWLVGCALRPIDDISAAAGKIAGGQFSQRINVAEAESELGRLAAVLNSTFARLDAAFSQQQQFTADAAHELRTPVSVMLTQTQSALNRERSAAEYRQTIQACQRSAQRMRRLIESLLELARLDAGQEPMIRLPVDLVQTVRDCVNVCRPLAEERSVNIHCELAPVRCAGDAGRLAQVVTNLLTNAIQYTRQGDQVRLTTRSQAGLAVLAVADNGPGIAAADLPHVFERFYRADPSRAAGHAGLGLAIAKAVVEAHGGMLEVASEENLGTTFTVRLPR